MPSTIIRNLRAPGKETEQRLKSNSSVTGTVWADPVYNNPKEGLVINQVMFTPGARTFWHHHEHGQTLQVVIGTGWVCEKGGKPQRINVGDLVVCPSGTTHWHGADDGTVMIHTAISHGKTTWLDEVTEEEYAAKN